jgi:hypothetical protein
MLWNWIYALDHGADRDLAIRAYAETLGKTDPALARAKASEIDNESMRNGVVSSLQKR